PSGRRNLPQQVTKFVVVKAGNMPEGGTNSAHQVELIKFILVAAQPVGHDNLAWLIVKPRGEHPIGTGGVDAAPLRVIYITRPSLVVIMPTRQTPLAVVFVKQVVVMAGIRLDQLTGAVLGVIGQACLLASIYPDNLLQIAILPSQRQLDAIAVAHPAEFACLVAHQFNAITMTVRYATEVSQCTLLMGKVTGLLAVS